MKNIIFYYLNNTKSIKNKVISRYYGIASMIILNLLRIVLFPIHK